MKPGGNEDFISSDEPFDDEEWAEEEEGVESPS